MIYLWKADLRSLAIYLLCILMSIFFSHIYWGRKTACSFWKRCMSYLLISAPVALFVGCRGRITGADTIRYIYHFLNYSKINYGEITYKFFLELSNNIGKGKYYTILFLIYSFITMVFLVAALDIYIDNGDLSCALFMFYCFLGLYMTDQMRQLAGVTIAFWGCGLLTKKRYFWGGIGTVLALLIHTSSLVVFGGWIIFSGIKNKRKILFRNINGKGVMVSLRALVLVFIGSIGIPLFYMPLFRFLADIVPKAYRQFFTTQVNVKAIGFGLLLDIMPLLFLLFLAWEYGKEKTVKNDWLYDYSMLLLPFRIIGYYSFFISRLIYYPMFACIILISIKAAKSRIVLYSAIIMSILYFIINYMYIDLHGVFPYVTFWEMY